jgi:hypothetical protein
MSVPLRLSRIGEWLESEILKLKIALSIVTALVVPVVAPMDILILNPRIVPRTFGIMVVCGAVDELSASLMVCSASNLFTIFSAPYARISKNSGKESPYAKTKQDVTDKTPVNEDSRQH